MAVCVGDTVEICCDEDGFWGAYFVARVLEKSKNKFLVEYTTLVTEEDEKVFLKETVDARMLRPLPPKINVSGFNMLEKVDAYDNDGWWEGRIAARIGSNYCVYFETYGVSIEYPMSRLRPHQEHVDGKWIPSLGRGLYTKRVARIS